MSSPSPRVEGTVLAGRYVVERKLGSGSLGTVYLAYDMEHAAPLHAPSRRRKPARLGRLVAVKVIRAERLSPSAIRVLQDEFRTFAALRHPQIAAVHDFGYLEGGAPYYTREYVQGTPLPPGPPRGEPAAAFLRPILDVLEALEHLHAAELLHLDVHPGNLIVADEAARGSVLIDFGLPRSMEPRGTTPSIALPPELLLPGKASAASDLFMAGVLLIHRLTGRADVDPRLPAEIPGWGSRVTLELERIASKAVRPSPRERFASASELRSALEGALGGRRIARSATRLAEVTSGREPELAAIQRTLESTAAGSSSVLAFTGRPGIGKSRLLDEARIRAQLRGLAVVFARFSPGALAEPALASRLLGMRSIPRAELGWLEPLSRDHGGTPEERAGRAAAAYFASEGRPLVLVLDDVEHADPESRRLIDALAGETPAARQAGARALGIIAASEHAVLPGGRRAASGLKPLPAAHAERCLRAFLGPLEIPRSVALAALRTAGGIPLRLRRLAIGFRDAWGSKGSIPRSAPLPEIVEAGPASGLPPRVARDPVLERLIAALAVLERAADAREIAAAADLPLATCARGLRTLVEVELAAAERRGRSRVYGIGAAAAAAALASIDAAEIRAMHLRSAAHLESEGSSDPAGIAHRARHLLRGGRRREGKALAMEAVEKLRDRGALDAAMRLLEDALELEAAPGTRLVLLERASAIIEEIGSHSRGIALLAPFLERREGFSARRRVRLLRLAGIHYHRGGFPERALEIFDLLRKTAHPRRDAEDIIFSESELAELHTYRGRYEEAEQACRRGLGLLEATRASEPFRSRMEVILRASLGHLELRRMNLIRARSELARAWSLARGRRMRSIQAVILNNLGIAERQLGLFESARRRWTRAERLLSRAGEGRSLVKIACNLAVVEGQRGRRAAAEEQVERARRILLAYPGERIEFFVKYTEGVVAHLFGDARAAIEVLEEAIPLGQRLGDAHLARFGEILLAEALVASGRLAAAGRLLASRGGGEPPLLRRMAAARRLTLARLLGNERAAKEAIRILESEPRTEAAVPEAWNDLHRGLAALLAGEPLPACIGSALASFRKTGVPSGERFALVLLLADALRAREPARVQELRGDLGRAGPAAHRFLAIVEPLVLAQARLAAGDAAAAGEAIAAAASEGIGFSSLELDWMLELCRGRIALGAGDPAGARRHAQRGLEAREVLAALVPAASRERFRSHPRFRGLLELARRLERIVPARTPVGERPGAFEGMVGRSIAMARVFESIEKLRGQDLAVLIRGETGTGKDMVARALHATSSRSAGPYQAIHCAALPDELLEAELFGHEAGAFTGAAAARPGILEVLAGGTLLLDQVEHLSARAQAKLLHATGAGRARRLGSAADYGVDVRILSSTSADLRAATGSFRRDIFYRLAAVEIEIPPLRERAEDIALLAKHLLDVHARRLERSAPGLEPGAVELLEGHEWPGNVRELEAVLFRSLLEASGADRVGAETIRRLLPDAHALPLVPEKLLEGRTLDEVRREVERAYVLRLHREVKGDLSAMMAALGVRRTQLYELLRKLGLDIRALREEPPR